VKKALFLACLISALTLIGCASTSNSSSEKEDTKVDYVTKYQLKNEISVFCPTEVSNRREGVIYGQTSHVSYFSNTCNMNRAFSILLPPSYDGEKEFPVIYFQHGIFGDENCILFDQNNRIKEITANLAADGNAKEVIMVFGNMYATSDPNQKPGFAPEAVLPYDNFINELVNDLMPYIESHYKVLKGRENTAVCGFSMGGRESLYIGLEKSDLFGYIGAIAPAPGVVPAKDWAMSHAGMYSSNDQMKFKEGNPLPELLMVCCGTNDGTVGQFPKSYHRILVENNVDHLWFEVMGADHNSDAIKAGLYHFLLRAFN